MNSLQVEAWLEQMLPIETELKAWFEKHRAPMPKQVYFSKLPYFDKLRTQSDPAFHELDPEQLGFSEALLRNQNSLSDTLCFQPNENISIRKHPRYLPEIVHGTSYVEIVYVFRGSCTQTFYYEDGNETIQMRQGDICVIQPDFENTKGVYDDSLVINIMVRKSALQNSLSDLIADTPLLGFFFDLLYQTDIKNYLLFNTGDDTYIRSSLLDMMVEMCESKSFNQRVAFLMLALVFMHLQRDYTHTMKFSSHLASNYNYIPRFLMYLEQHYASFSLTDMSAYFHLNASYISRLFKEHTNTTLSQKLQQIRINMAKKMLENTKLSVNHICSAVGYDDCTYFIRVFKKFTGDTPLQYRKHIQK